MADITDLVNSIIRLENRFAAFTEANNESHLRFLVELTKIQTEIPAVKLDCAENSKRIEEVEEDLDATKGRIGCNEKNISSLNSKIKILLSILIPAILSAGSIITASIISK
jgi:peptidoglycan hydrolase CwlO-like protein